MNFGDLKGCFDYLFYFVRCKSVVPDLEKYKWMT